RRHGGRYRCHRRRSDRARPACPRRFADRPNLRSHARCHCEDEARSRTRAYRGVRRRWLAPEACVVGAATITKRRSSSMKKVLKAILFLSLVAAGARPLLAQQPSTAAWDSVGRILGTAPTSAAGYIRYNLPRRDLTVRLGDVTVSPALALGAWAGFSGEPNDATMMGDLVLTAAERAPVLAELAHQHIGVSAIHNHIVGEQPEIIYVHILGQGNALELATRL